MVSKAVSIKFILIPVKSKYKIKQSCIQPVRQNVL